VTINACETVQVQVWINTVSDLYGADVRLSFDPSVLEVVDYNPGTPGVIELEPGGFLQPPLWTILNSADNVAGTNPVRGVPVEPHPPVNGSGVLFIVRFRARTGATLSPLLFTYTRLSNRDGEEILASSIDGTAATVPPAGPTLSAARLNSTTARLTWTASPAIAEYHLYRDTMPYFTPAAPPYVTTTGLTYDDVGALGMWSSSITMWSDRPARPALRVQTPTGWGRMTMPYGLRLPRTIMTLPWYSRWLG